MTRCQFCASRASDVIRIGGGWFEACCRCADLTQHSDRTVLTSRILRRLRG